MKSALKSSLHYFAIDKQVTIPYGEMQRLDANEAVRAAKNSHGKVQIYLRYEDNQDPDVGYVFEDGKFTDTNLGSDRTRQMTDELAPQRGREVSDDQEVWFQFFNVLDNG